MSDVYTQENGSKKKFLAPVLVILLCMVSLTAAGYAYNATMSVPDQGPDAGDLQINFLNGTPATDIDASAADDVIVFTDNFVWSVDKTGATPVWTSTNQVKAFVTTGYIKYDLKITGEGVAKKIIVDSDNVADYLDIDVGDAKISNLVAIKVGITDDVASAVDLGEAIAVNKVANADYGFSLYLFFKAVSDTPVDIADDGSLAASFKPAVEDGSFSIKITADSEAPASP